jgi:cell division septum initiation protein DivIVA
VTVDIDYLLERLEEAITAGSRVPFSRRVLVDDEECLAIIEQIREAVPEEIQRARRIQQDRERMLAEAQERARLIITQAQHEASELVSEHAMVRAAEARAAEIRAEAMRAADEIRREADEYAYQVLERLERHLTNTQQLVRRGLRELRQGTPHDYGEADEDETRS